MAGRDIPRVRGGTKSCTFRLTKEEIAFLESLTSNGITAGLRKLLLFGRGVGYADKLVQMSSSDIVYGLIARVERLESRLIGLSPNQRD